MRADPGDRVGHSRGRHAVFVQYRHGIAHAFHVQPGNRAPAAADQIDALVMGAHDLGQFRHHLPDMLAQPVLAARHLLQAEGAKLGRDASAHLPVRDLGQFHRVAADVANQPARVRPAQQHALGGQAGFLLSVDDPHLDAGFAFDAGLEFGAVRRLAHGGGGHAGQRVDVHALGKRRKALQGGKAPLDAFGVQAARLGHLGPQPGHDLFVIEIGGRARRAVKDHQPDRVRSHIDHPHPRQGPLGQGREHLAERLDLLAGRCPHAVHRASPAWVASHLLMTRRDGGVNHSNGSVPERRRPPPCPAPTATDGP